MVAARVAVCRRDLLLNPFGSSGQYVVKDPLSGAYFKVGEHEYFLLRSLDGRHDRRMIQQAFKQRFGEELTDEELLGFLKLAQSRGLLEYVPRGGNANGTATAPLPASTSGMPGSSPAASSDAKAEPGESAAAPVARRNHSLLYWRRSLIDPDSLLGQIERRVRFFWTFTFVALSAIAIVSAAVLVFFNLQSLVSHFVGTLSWQTLVVVWCTLLGITVIHEFGHGLTCKHHGGQVHEMGLLMMCFMPCLYCNVSDAWLIREKSKRLWVTLAGGYIELCLWALAVFVWRLTVQDTLLNYIALMVITISGFRILLNFNPFLKLDGYYLLSDALEIENLRQRSLDYVSAHVRWLLWGAERPERDARGKTLLAYGVACWVFSTIFLAFMLTWFGSVLSEYLGPVGYGLVAILAVLVLRGLFRGFLGGEVKQMFLVRHRRLAYSVMLLGLAAAALALIHKEKRVTGTFEVRPMTRTEVRAPVAGFLKEIMYQQGDEVSAGSPIARLEIPDLESRLAQKRAEIDEAEAKLRLLETGPRQEEVAEQQQRVKRAEEWRDLARKDLEKSNAAFQEELTRLDQKIKQYEAEVQQAKSTVERARQLFQKNVISEQVYQEEQKKRLVATALYEQAVSEKSVRESLGTVEAQQELDRREKELADEQGALALLEAGSRPEEIEAERAKLARLQEEMNHLQDLDSKLLVKPTQGGTISTPHLREKIGQYFEEGGLICEVEESSALQTEITLAEQEVPHVEPGQRIELKARALPFQTFEATVDRVAPRAEAGDVQSTVVVYCQLEDRSGQLKPGMTGYGRIDCGQQPIGKILADHVLRYIRTEFWW